VTVYSALASGLGSYKMLDGIFASGAEFNFSSHFGELLNSGRADAQACTCDYGSTSRQIKLHNVSPFPLALRQYLPTTTLLMH
ncbi:uncharacterized protein METZ01_LOCUS13910, partial [marine metagenome]